MESEREAIKIKKKETDFSADRVTDIDCYQSRPRAISSVGSFGKHQKALVLRFVPRGLINRSFPINQRLVEGLEKMVKITNESVWPDGRALCTFSYSVLDH